MMKLKGICPWLKQEEYYILSLQWNNNKMKVYLEKGEQ